MHIQYTHAHKHTHTHTHTHTNTRTSTNTHTHTLHARSNKKIITDGIELILDNNFFQFNNVKYRPLEQLWKLKWHQHTPP